MSKKKDNQSDILEFANSSDKPSEKNEGVITSSNGDVIKLGVEGREEKLHTPLD